MDSFKTLNFDESDVFLPTNIEAIDSILGGGIPIGRVTEIFGQAGVGKTQLCLQLCANARLPKHFGGLNGKSVYLDCHGGFNSKRLYEICNSAQEAVVSSMPIEAYKNAARKKFCSNSMLEDIYYRRIDNLEQINHALEDLVTGILPNSRVKLLVIDSIAFHFRYSILDGEADIKALLHGIIQKLNTLAYTYKMAVIVTNQMTTQILQPTTGNGDVIVSGDLIPALGESWSHACSTSLEINFVKMETRQNKRLILRELNIVKSPLVKSPSKTYFYISEEGICNRNVSK